MSLYNLMHGMNPLTPLVLGLLGKNSSDFGRFRDCRIAAGKIAIYARVGGGNRDEYWAVFSEMEEHPLFDRVEDASHDSTYATFFFNYPAEYAEDLKIIQDVDPFDPAEEFEKVMASFDPMKGVKKASDSSGKAPSVQAAPSTIPEEKKEVWLRIAARLLQSMQNTPG